MPEKEKRRYKRMNVDLKLNISKLFHQDNGVIANIDAPIEVTDISKGVSVSHLLQHFLPDITSMPKSN